MDKKKKLQITKKLPYEKPKVTSERPFETQVLQQCGKCETAGTPVALFNCLRFGLNS